MRTYIFGAFLAVAIGVGLGTAQQSEPSQPEQPAAKTYPKGRTPPNNLRALYDASFLRHKHKLRALPNITAPAYDCRKLNIVPPIRNQSDCGSCWDFSGIRVCTSAFLKAGWGKNDGSFAFSEQYVLDCGHNGGCNGDDNTTVTAMAKSQGLPLTSDYGPYQGGPGRCKSGAKLYQISDWGFASSTNNQGVCSVQDIKNAMVAYGPIGCAIAADNAFMNTPAGGVFDSTTSTQIDHDITLIGWDDSKGRHGAWILDNSWGTNWADEGRCWIGYGVNQVGTEAIFAVAPPSPNPPQPPDVSPVPWTFKPGPTTITIPARTITVTIPEQVITLPGAPK